MPTIQVKTEVMLKMRKLKAEKESRLGKVLSHFQRMASYGAGYMILKLKPKRCIHIPEGYIWQDEDGKIWFSECRPIGIKEG